MENPAVDALESNDTGDLGKVTLGARLNKPVCKLD